MANKLASLLAMDFTSGSPAYQFLSSLARRASGVFARATFGAASIINTTAAVSYVPAGSGALTVTNAASGVLAGATGSVSSFTARHIAGANAAQTVRYRLLKTTASGTVSTLADVTLPSATTGGSTTRFTSVPLAIGDYLTVSALPSATLDAVVTGIQASASLGRARRKRSLRPCPALHALREPCARAMQGTFFLQQVTMLAKHQTTRGGGR